jgi:alpha-glucosidase
MRLTRAEDVSYVERLLHGLRFRGSAGEEFRLSVLEEGIVRVQHLPEGKPRSTRTWMIAGPGGTCPREGRDREDTSPFSCPPFELEQANASLTLRTSRLGVRVHTGDFALEWSDPAGRVFARDLLGRAYAYDQAGKTLFHYLQQLPDEHYYGFGEKSGLLNKRGRRLRMLGVDALGYDAETTDPLYKHFPFYITFLPELQIAYGLLYDNTSTVTFDLGKEIDNYFPHYRYFQADSGDLDYYLLYGPSIPEVVEKLARLTGRPFLPPRWSLGYLASGMAYAESAQAQQQLEAFLDNLEKHDIPCDLFQLSSGYTTAADGQRHVFTWNQDKIPDPPRLAQRFHQAGVRLAANVKPAFLLGHPRFADLASQGALIQDPETGEPQLNSFWGGTAAYLDFTNLAGYGWWQAQIRESLLNVGIDAIWDDNNEYDGWDDAGRCAGFGEALPIGDIRPVQGLLMAQAAFEVLRSAQPSLRPFVITRSAMPGSQRYAQTWSGDNATSWHTLRFNTPMGLGLGLSAMPNFGHDIGGFAGEKPDPELLVRWVQSGVFMPRFTIHSWVTKLTEPWMYPQVLPLIRKSIQDRYRLLPYLYSLFWEAGQSGHPIQRPLVYAFPQDPHCVDESFDFLFGPSLLVAPVFTPGQWQRTLYLPQGESWYDLHGRRWLTGCQEVVLSSPLEWIPTLARSGAIIPTGKSMRHVGAEPDDLRRVYAFPAPGESSGSFDLIEDDGLTLDYQQGKFSSVRLEVHASVEEIILEATLAHAGHPLPYSELEWVLPAGEERPMRTPNVLGRWQDDQQRWHLRVPAPAG